MRSRGAVRCRTEPGRWLRFLRPWFAAWVAVGGAAIAEEEGGDEEAPAEKPAAARVDQGFEVSDLAFPENVARPCNEGGAWLPVDVEFKATGGRTVQALLEGDVGEPRERATTRQWVEVSPGAPRRAWLYLRVPPGERLGAVRFEVKSAAGAVVRRGNSDWSV